MAGPSESVKGASPRLSRVLLRRIVVAVVVIVIASVPFAVFAVISGQAAASSWAVLGGAAAVTNLMIGGRQIAYLAVGLMTALTPVAIVSGSVPVAGAAVMAMMCFGVGLSATQGLNRGLMLIPMYLAFMIIAPPPWSGHTAVDRTSSRTCCGTCCSSAAGRCGRHWCSRRCCRRPRCRCRHARNRGLGWTS